MSSCVETISASSFERLRSRAILKKKCTGQKDMLHLFITFLSECTVCHTDWKTLIHGLVFWQVCLSICTCQEGGQGGTSNRRLHGEVLDHHTLDSSTPTNPSVTHVCVCATCLTCGQVLLGSCGCVVQCRPQVWTLVLHVSLLLT